MDEYKQYSMCINCMLCYAACPIYGLDPEFIGPAAIALAQRYNLDSRDEGAAERLEILSQHEGIWGCTFVGECTRSVRSTSIPPGPSSATSSKRRAGDGSRPSSCRGVADEPRSPGYTDYHPRWYRSREVHLLVAQRRPYVAFILRELSSVFVAWFVVFLLLLGPGGRAAGSPSTASSWPGRRRPPVLLVNLVSLFFVVFHAITWFNLAPQAMVVRLGGRRVPGTWIAASNYAAWAAGVGPAGLVLLGG